MSDQGRNADILQSIVDDVPYTYPPQSRIEDLLLQVKEVIEEGGGGGGGDVTSVNGKTGAVTLTASDVGAYTTAETDALLGDKQSETLSASVKIGTETETTVEGAIGEVAAIIPATAAVSNKLSTAADTAKEDITATANSEDIALTDSADARVQDLKIYGTEDGVGASGLTVTACGKNLFKLPDKAPSHVGFTITEDVDAGEIRIVGSNNGDNTIKLYLSYPVKAGKQYVFTDGNSATLTAGIYICMRGSSGGTQYSVTHRNTIQRFIAPEDELYIFIWISSGVEVDHTFKIALYDADEYIEGEKFEPYKGTAVPISTALPLRSKTSTVGLGDFDWRYETLSTYESGSTMSRFVSTTNVSNLFDPTPFKAGDINSDNYLLANESCSSTYTVNIAAGGHDPITDKTFIVSRRGTIYIIDNSYTDPAEFKTAVTGITLTYPSYCDEIDLADGVAITRLDSNGDVLATTVMTPLSDVEKAAFAEFRTFDGSTNITATDDPFMTLNYVRNTDNGKALADVDNKSAVRMAMIAAPYDDTATYAVGNYCTYGDRLWKCNTAIGTAEPFTAGHWTATTVMEEI